MKATKAMNCVRHAHHHNSGTFVMGVTNHFLNGFKVQSSLYKFELISDTVIGVGKRSEEESEWWMLSKHILWKSQRANKSRVTRDYFIKEIILYQFSVSALIIAMT